MRSTASVRSSDPSPRRRRHQRPLRLRKQRGLCFDDANPNQEENGGSRRRMGRKHGGSATRSLPQRMAHQGHHAAGCGRPLESAPGRGHRPETSGSPRCCPSRARGVLRRARLVPGQEDLRHGAVDLLRLEEARRRRGRPLRLPQERRQEEVLQALGRR
ncbi:putative SWI/SNF-related matrix-associated actin-dependent regulator of chromatin subfamily A member 3-like 3 [Iris pallida]|uniref:SWI/SNF-related matrix-associated actin-dependent regulator of chromatin subfamily A member 3-like 3 n=1 Tax=Iris pallida TaxID=29817 RepID=A0AAX6FQK2_IRIPA|nr:putative SWI/SNF-related matrix-associated actin-dependent regulator of chromatin subfamily A member 3-like 3 [Iris pallida]KAJ6841652.1 putative SWI/SNF-related matrix-associated actin-dependent regulator of chromatin subfamily A member 3-like 3 [Iris pallida]